MYVVIPGQFGILTNIAYTHNPQTYIEIELVMSLSKIRMTEPVEPLDFL